MIERVDNSLKKDYIVLGLIAIVIVFIGIFIYPTVYKYDKLDQKFPVKINRITGKTHILLGYEWREATTDDTPKVDEVELIKQEIFDKLEQDRIEIKQEIELEIKSELNVENIKTQVIEELKNEIAAVKSELEQYKKFETNPDNYFTTGDTRETVKEIMGVPTSTMKQYDGGEVWFYGTSTIEFKNGKVSVWSNPSKNLRIK